MPEPESQEPRRRVPGGWRRGAGHCHQDNPCSGPSADSLAASRAQLQPRSGGSAGGESRWASPPLRTGGDGAPRERQTDRRTGQTEPGATLRPKTPHSPQPWPRGKVQARPAGGGGARLGTGWGDGLPLLPSPVLLRAPCVWGCDLPSQPCTLSLRLSKGPRNKKKKSGLKSLSSCHSCPESWCCPRAAYLCFIVDVPRERNGVIRDLLDVADGVEAFFVIGYTSDGKEKEICDFQLPA